MQIRASAGRLSLKPVTLPTWDAITEEPSSHDTTHEPSTSQQQQEVPSRFLGRGLPIRVTCYCIGDSFDRGQLQDQILRRSSASSVRAFPDVICSTYSSSPYPNASEMSPGQGNIFFFDFGCVVFWGLETSAERHIIREIALPCANFPLSLSREERDRVLVLYTTAPQPVVQNDALSIHWSHWDDINSKLAVSFALAQSTKLTVYEEELRLFVKQVSHLPERLAERGEVPMSERDVMRAIGELYVICCAMNQACFSSHNHSSLLSRISTEKDINISADTSKWLLSTL